MTGLSIRGAASRTRSLRPEEDHARKSDRLPGESAPSRSSVDPIGRSDENEGRHDNADGAASESGQSRRHTGRDVSLRGGTAAERPTHGRRQDAIDYRHRNDDRSRPRSRSRSRTPTRDDGGSRDVGRRGESHHKREGRVEEGDDRHHRRSDRYGSDSTAHRRRSRDRDRRSDRHEGRHGDGGSASHRRAEKRREDRDDRSSRRRARHSSEEASSDESVDDQHRKRSRRHSSSKRDRSPNRRKRRDSEREREREKGKAKGSRSSNATTSDSWGKYGVITEKDITLKAAEFRVWLIEERRLNPERIDKDKRKREFARFVHEHNSAAFPHDKFYNMAAYDRRMAMIRNGDTLAPETSTKEEKDEWDKKMLTYNFEMDEQAHLARIRASHAPLQAELTKEEIMELRRIEKERLEISQMRRLGMDIPRSMGVRMEEVVRESVADMNLFHS